MLRTPAPETPAIDRTACPSRGGHGTRHHRNVNGCTCRDALLDQRRYNKLWRGGRTSSLLVDATGSRRRLQALATLGYGVRPVADRLGITSPCLQRVRSGRYSQVSMTTARRIAAVYRDLVDRPAPGDSPGKQSGVVRARTYAAARNWAGPADWDDIDDPAARPDRTAARDVAAKLTVEDIRWLMTDAGGRHRADEIGRMYGLEADTIRRRLARAPHALTEAQRDAIRDEYRAAAHGEFVRAACAARHGIRPVLVDQALRGGDGYPDLIAELGRKHGRPGSSDRDKPLHPPEPVDDDRMHAIRADYAAGGIGTHRLARRYGITQHTVLRIVRGAARPHLGLEDLTAHKRGDNTAATPTSRETGKESAA